MQNCGEYVCWHLNRSYRSLWLGTDYTLYTCAPFLTRYASTYFPLSNILCAIC